MKKNLEEKVEKILSKRNRPGAEMYLCQTVEPKRNILPWLKVFAAFLAVFVFCFFLTTADYANRDLGNIGGGGLFSVSVLGENMNIIFFNESFSIKLPTIVTSFLNLVSDFFNRL